MSAHRRLGVATLAVAACLFSPTGAAAETRTYQLGASFDTYVSAAHPWSHYGRARRLKVGARPIQRAYLRFNLRRLEGVILSATLRVRVVSGRGSSFSVRRVRPGRRSFAYRNAPRIGRWVASAPVATPTWVEVDVTQAVRRRRLLKLALTSPDARRLRIASRNSVSPPQLVVETQLPTSYLDNGSVRVGVDLSRGGAITYIAPASGGENVINNYDLGRQVQQSYYAGPRPFGQPAAPWQDMPWNPIGTGDRYGHPSKVLETTNDGTTLYVKSQPQQWALRDVLCECVFEQWLTVDGDAIWVRNRLTNNRSDTTQYPAFGQELPAVYTIGKLNKVVAYTGPRPYSNGAVSEMALPPDLFSFEATEHWAALVNADGWGLGLVQPDVQHFIARFVGPPDAGGSSNFSSGYFAPDTQEILDANITYDYSYGLVLGTVDEIRSYAASLPRDPAPTYVFDSTRDHWWYQHTVDAGWPLSGSLKVDLGPADPALMGPTDSWLAADVPSIFLRAAYSGAQETNAQLFWRGPGQGFAQARSIQFKLAGGGGLRTYRLDLSRVASYTGEISQLRFDPSPGGEPGASVDVAYIAGRSLG